MKSLKQRAELIKLFISDVDGVLTDGTIYLGDAHPQEHIKPFNTQDGLGIKLLIKTGIIVAVITARESAIVKNRMQALGVQYIFQGAEDKRDAYETLKKELNLVDSQIAYVGDDLPDLPCIMKAGLGIAVKNANGFVKQHADWETTCPGGHGAVREVCELIMDAQGTLLPLQSEYLA